MILLLLLLKVHGKDSDVCTYSKYEIDDSGNLFSVVVALYQYGVMCVLYSTCFYLVNLRKIVCGIESWIIKIFVIMS